MHDEPRTKFVGRGAQASPANRFEAVHAEADFEQIEADDDLLAPRRAVPTEFLADRSRSIIATNDSPDVGFRYSINAYRGCEHGCAYCYARPSHELLGMNAGLDFETKVMVKHDAPALLREALCRPAWTGEMIMMSGVTDCYQPAERRLRLTRGLLEVMLEARQSCGIITKNALVVRDLDILTEMAALNLVHVHISVTTLDADLVGVLEPRTSRPAARLEAIRRLTAAGVPVGVLVAPIIPGLTDHEPPQVLEAVAAAGAKTASYVLLRLPHTVRPVFLDWLAANRPAQYERVESRIRATRDGKLYNSAFGERQRGRGKYAEQIAQNFRVFKKKYGLDGSLPPLDTSLFHPPRAASGQMNLF
ncbi:MAG: PA0069 family radical SAM protein [Planctomycetia bacterium]|nr:PA0069 family radical SAM protein [Planctomycetia bacterium]